MLDNKEFEDKAWGLMLERLDKEKPEKKLIAWWKYIGILLLLFLGSAAVYSSFFDSGDDKEIVNVAPIIAQTAIGSQQGVDLKENSDVALTKSRDASKVDLVTPIGDVEARETEFSNELKHINNLQLIETVQESKSYNVGESKIEPSTVDIASIQQKDDPTIVFGTDETLVLDVEPTRDISEVGRTFPKVGENKRKSDFAWQQHEATGLPSITTLEIDETNSEPIIFSTLEKPIAERRVQSFVAAETSYLSDFDQLSLRLSLLSEIGSTQSPWSMTTGLSYQRVRFSSFSLFGNSDREFADATLGDTTNEETLPTNVGDINAERRSIGSLVYVDYVGIPLLFSYRMNRLQVGLGIENSFAVSKRFDTGNEFFSNEVYEDQVFNYQLNLSQEINYNVSSLFQVGMRARFDLTGAHGYNSDYLRNLDQFGIQLKYRIR